MGETKKKFYNELYTYMQGAIKYGAVDEEEATRILYELSFEEQKDWLTQMEAKEAMAYDNAKEGNL